MGKVVLSASMSLDGYVSGPGESGFEHLFAWHHTGDKFLGTTHPERSFRLTQTSYDYFSGIIATTGALVVGRRLFDMTNGWGGDHPMGCPTVVLTHSVPEGWAPESEKFVFVTEGIHAAVAKAREIAGEKNVGVSAGITGGQALEAGLIDELAIELVPVVLGGGVPFFASLATVPVLFEGPVEILPGVGVTHLRYRVKQ